MNTCFICKKSYTNGIGICCSRQCHNKRINTRSRDNDRHVLLKKQKIVEYESNPKLCKHCNQPLTWNQRFNKFCTNTCSATFYGATRSQDSIKKQREKLIEKLINENKRRYPYTKVSFIRCAHCEKAFRKTKHTPKYCSLICKSSGDIKKYRFACKFKISNKNHPELYNWRLLAEHGWYRAANHPKGHNPKGATWDHLFRIEDGYKMGVDPAVMSHPANAEMISWEENFARKTSIITYDELLSRISKWKK